MIDYYGIFPFYGFWRNPKIVHGAPIVIGDNGVCIDAQKACGGTVDGVAKLKLVSMSRHDEWIEFQSDDRDESQRVCFTWPDGAFDDKPLGRYIGTLTIGKCCVNMQFELPSCRMTVRGVTEQPKEVTTCE